MTNRQYLMDAPVFKLDKSFKTVNIIFLRNSCYPPINGGG